MCKEVYDEGYLWIGRILVVGEEGKGIGGIVDGREERGVSIVRGKEVV